MNSPWSSWGRGAGGRPQRLCRRLALAFCLCGLAAAHGGGSPGDPVTLVLQWQHQAQFAGYYMAQAKGLYEKQGLSVQILRGGPDVRPVELMQAGKADFGCLMLSTALGQRGQGVPLVQLAQVVNRSNFLLVAWRQPADGGGPVQSLADLDGRKVTVWTDDFRAPYLAMCAARGVRPVILPQYNTFSLFLHRGVAACAAMRYNEYHTLLQSGIAEEDVRVFALANHGANMPEDGVYCLEDNWRRRPQVCRAFARASLEGWRYARDHADETLDVTMQYVEREKLPTNRPHMRWMLKEMLASVFPGPDDRWAAGRLSRPVYQQTVEILTRYAGLRNAPRYENVVKEEAADELR